MKSSLIQAKRCAEEFAKVVGLEFIDRYVVNGTYNDFFRCQL